jgi:hypothetical protein
VSDAARKEHDRRRHALIGNAVTVDVGAWLGERLAAPYLYKYVAAPGRDAPLRDGWQCAPRLADGRLLDAYFGDDGGGCAALLRREAAGRPAGGLGALDAALAGARAPPAGLLLAAAAPFVSVR